MAKYEVTVLQPGVTQGTSGITRKYSEDVLREAADTLDGVQVVNGYDRADPSSVVGVVIDAEYDDGVTCTVEITGPEAIEKVDDGLLTIAPRLRVDADEQEEPVEVGEAIFNSLFLTPEASKLVGPTERKE